MRLLILFVLFQSAWFANVLGGAHGLPWIGPLATAGLIAWAAWQYDGRRAIFRAGYGVVVGLVLDGALLGLDFVAFPQHAGAFLPLWMLALWAGFAAVLPHMVPWLAGRRGLAVLFGFLGGPGAYWTAEQFDAVALAGAWEGLLAVGVAWAVAMAVLPLRAGGGFASSATDDARPCAAARRG